MENDIEGPQKLRVELTYNTATHLLGIYLKMLKTFILKIYVPLCSLQNYSQCIKHGNKESVGFFYIFNFTYLFIVLFKYSCLYFHPNTLPCPTDPRLPPSNLPPLALSLGSLYMFLDGPSTITPYY